MTLAEFLAWEERQELRYEFDGFQPVAMTGGTAAHAVLQQNLAVSLGGRLRGTPCRMYGSDLKIEAVGSIRYPDAFVVCTPVAPSATVVRNPLVIFEVLNPGTAGTDRIVKNREYAATPSVRRYVMLEQNQNRVAATVFARQEAGWVGHLVGAGGYAAPARDRTRAAARRALRGRGPRWRRRRGGRPRGGRRRHLNDGSDVASMLLGCD
jgi:Uma2 family endonuclease